MLAVLDEGALDLLGGPVALGDLHPVGDPAHVELGHRRALAGMDVLGRQDDVELAVDVDDVALAERAGDDLHVVFLGRCCRPAWRDAGRNIAILSPHRQHISACLRVQASMPEPDASRLALVDAARPCRPPAVPAGAQRASRPPCAAGSSRADFVEVETGGPAGLAGQRGAPARLRHRAARRPTASARRSICTPRRSSPARSCWRPASGGSFDLRPCLPQPRARRRCTIRNSPCSNGTGPASPTRR